MNANILKRIYLGIRSNNIKMLAIRVLRSLGLRHLVIRFDTNFICNLRCKMCYFHQREKLTMHPPMPLESYRKIAAQIYPKTRVLYLSCGAEPLCTPNIGDYLAIAREYKVPFISMTSNCMLLSDDKIEAFVRHGLDEIIVSVTGGTKETYEDNHRGADWEKLWGNLRRLEEAKKQAGASRPVVKFNYILTKKSIAEVETFIEKVKPFAPDFITLRELAPFPDMDEAFYAENRLNSLNLGTVADIKKTFEAAGIGIVNSIQCTDADRPARNALPEKHFCIAPEFQYYINAEGDLQPCRFRPLTGNLARQDLKDILKSAESKTFYESLSRLSTNECHKNCPDME